MHLGSFGSIRGNLCVAQNTAKLSLRVPVNLPKTTDFGRPRGRAYSVTEVLYIGENRSPNFCSPMVSPDQKLLRESFFQLQNSNPHLEVFHRTLKMLHTRTPLSRLDFPRRAAKTWANKRSSEACAMRACAALAVVHVQERITPISHGR